MKVWGRVMCGNESHHQATNKRVGTSTSRQAAPPSPQRQPQQALLPNPVRACANVVRGKDPAKALSRLDTPSAVRSSSGSRSEVRQGKAPRNTRVSQVRQQATEGTHKLLDASMI